MLAAVAMWPFSLTFAADKEEWEEEVHVVRGMQKLLHSLVQASEKLRRVSIRVQGQEEEMCLQQSKDQSLGVWKHRRKVRPVASKTVLWDKDTITS